MSLCAGGFPSARREKGLAAIRTAVERVIVIEPLELRRLLAGDFEWVVTAGSSLTDVGQAIAVDDQHVYVVGTFKNTIDFDPGPGTANLTSAGGADIFVAKYTQAGALAWARRTGGSGDEIAGAIAVDSAGNVYSTGTFRNTADFDPGAGTFNLTSAGANDIFAWKLTSAGNFAWAVRAGAAGDDAGRGIQLDASNNPTLTGHFSNTVDFDPGAGTTTLASGGSTDAFIWKLSSASGALMMAHKFGGTGADVGYDLAFDAAGNIFATGDFSNTVDFDPGAGVASLASAGIKDIYIVKLDAAGNHVFSRRFGGAGTDTGLGIALDASGNIFTTGLFGSAVDFDPGPGTQTVGHSGEKDIFVSKLDASGNYAWALGLGSPEDDDAHDIVTDAAGNVFVAGSFSGTIDFDPAAGTTANLTSAGLRDNFVLKLDNAGAYLFARATGSVTGGDYTKNLALDSAGGIYMTGHFNGTTDFDPGPGTQSRNNAGWSDIYVLKLSDGVPPVVLPPPTPTGLFAAPVSHTRIDLSWQDVAGETIYRIERSPTGTGNWEEIATVGGNVTSYQNTGLTAQTTYHYRVRAGNSGGNSEFSTATSATTPPAPPVLPSVSIAATDSSASEPGANTGRFAFTRTGDTTQPLAINYTISGSATNGGDFQAISGTITFVANASTAELFITPMDDDVFEGTETVTLSLASSSDYTIAAGAGSATVSIADDDPAPPPGDQPGLTGEYFDNQDLTNPKLTRVDSTVNFNWGTGSPHASVGPDTFSVRWTGQVQPEFSQQYRFYVDANNGVRLWVNDQLIIDRWTNAWGEVSGLINLTAGVKYNIKLEYFDFDNNANVKLSWSSASRSKQVIPQSALWTSDDESPPPPPPPNLPTVTIAAPDDVVTESSDANPFVVTRSGDTSQPLVVNYVVSGSATAGNDYVALSGTVTIPAGEAQGVILLQPIDDAVIESDESITLTLSSNAAYTIGSGGSSATMRLLDNEPPAAQTPFNATQTPWPITQRIEIEDFDAGDPGAAHFDSDARNNGGRYRTNVSVDIQNTTDTGGGFNVGWTRAGEWLEYTVNAAASGIYTLDVRVASSGSPGMFHFEIDGVDVTGPLTAGNTGGTQAWRTLSHSGIFISAGQHVVRLAMDSNGSNGGVGNFNHFQFTLAQSVPTVTIAATDASASEQGSDTGVFTVTRNPSAGAGSLTVFYTISGGTASSSDHVPLTGSVVIPAGQASAVIVVTPVDDVLIEGSETLILSLSPNQQYTIGTGASATVTIADNDQIGGVNHRPNTPVISEPSPEGVIVSAEAVQMEILPFSDPDPNDVHTATDWEIWTVGPTPERIWADLNQTDPVTRLHGRLGDGVFMGSYVGRTILHFDTEYELRMRVRDGSGDAATEWSEYATRRFRTNVEQTPLPTSPDWEVLQPGYIVEMLPVTFAAGEQEFRLPVNIVFVPNPGNDPDDPLFYVTELYGTIRVVTRDFTVRTYATNLLNYNPMGPISGSGEQGLSGLTIDPVTGDLFASMLYDDPNDSTTNTFGKITRFHSTDGGLSASSAVDILKMPGETQAQSHFISNLSIGPDGKLWAHNGDGFNSATALNLDSFRGKILRMNLDGTAASDNPFYDASNGIAARDYVYAYGFRNPFGGAWRESDGKHYVVENGPSTNDRLSRLTAGGNYGWNGTAASMTTNAIYNWQETVAPVNGAFVQPGTFGGSGFPAGKQDHLFITESGATYSTGPQLRGKAITEFVLDANGNVLSGPTTLIRYAGDGKATAVALAAGPDGLYFSDLYEDDPIAGSFIPTATGANILRVRYVGT